MFTCRKLVRDGIIPKMQAEKSEPVYHKAQGDEFIEALGDKAIEEATEFRKAHNGEERLEELIDMQEVILAGLAETNFSFEEFMQLVTIKSQKSGSLAAGIILDSIKMATDNPWVLEYYVGNPNFNEVKEDKG
jgi:predicted house-cleaning noncanonical NTP pyrophosphatase (MazG superfamily)